MEMGVTNVEDAFFRKFRRELSFFVWILRLVFRDDGMRTLPSHE